MSPRYLTRVVSLLAVLGLIGSGFGVEDRITWVLEVAPVLIGVTALLALQNKFILTPLVLGLLLVHSAILMLGGHYTYAEVPAGFWVQDWLGLERNPYDRLGHLAQGFIPAMLMREILIRTSPLKCGAWLFVCVTCICLAFSAFYEMIEWWAALALNQDAEAFLGTQGDPWDTQWDMFLALIGAITAQLTLSRVHDRQLAESENATAG
ncbi:DUF2238 domain-containing protein [Planctomycetota bacterium]|nr:DUF2238 domain-containing protein [Planctomycetota bacterium]